MIAALIGLSIILPTTSVSIYGSLSTSTSIGASSVAPSLTINTQDTAGAALTGYYVLLYQSGVPVSSGYSPATFTLVSGVTYVVESDGYGSCVFDHWLDTGSNNNQRNVSITSDTTLTSVLNCGGTTTTTSATSSATVSSVGITVYAHRIPASYWDSCFATACTNPYAPCDTTCTGPGATMYFALYDSAGNFITGGFANENGYTFTGLAQGATYYIYPDDCNMCHGSLHDVVFQHWGDGSTTRPIAVTVGQSLDAWYSCTNECA